MPPPTPGQGLNVVALISGGKDSFFSLLHCRANGHRVVALANLHPPTPISTRAGQGGDQEVADHDDDQEEADLNSFMYQTVGHEVIPLYAEATGLPLYRQEIRGDAGLSGKDYASRGAGADGDETESMVPLLRAVMAAHPEVNALCAGAILSTYQRTRVESVAVRLGLTPLAFLWKYPVLPLPLGKAGGDDAQLLADMAGAGMEARIVKVASGGLDESFLWEDVASPQGVDRLLRAMRRFGGAAAGSGAVIGEGGEFETLVVDGPPSLFSKRIVVAEDDRRVVREGGGTAWLKVRKARVEEKNMDEDDRCAEPRIPDLFDAQFAGVLEGLSTRPDDQSVLDRTTSLSGPPLLEAYQSNGSAKLQQWCVVGDVQSLPSIEVETTSLVEKVEALLHQASLPPTSIISTVVTLRHMSDFPTINKIYGSLFTEPNPPSRVTISCGDLLPPGCNIAVYLSVHHGLAPRARQGLHVQSRSYWAPANIGPYSQAISVPISGLSSAESSVSSPAAALVHIAGQIPLIPATMDLPSSSEPFEFSAVMSLQHLWRIGTETGVQWWSSAVAYLPHTPDEAVSTREKALVASRIWRAAHSWSPEDAEDDEAGPDLWDRRHNPAYMSFAADDVGAGPRTLPDRSVLDADDASLPLPAPAFFAAEVQELPRQARVEWHAHLGFAHLDDASIRVVALDSEMMLAQHTIVTPDDKGVFVHTVLAVKRIEGQTEKMPVGIVAKELQTLYLARIGALVGLEVAKGMGDVAPTHVYVHTGAVTVSAGDVGRDGCPVIPCFSLWSGKGEEVAAVAVYQAWFDHK
ncbi:adenine nucleotide alpha hydrolases-like protein [Coniochaeta ligniaria NRRL 30616]|uniref:Diphthine--ammonia ligase n=1 Tax=Coniochaeta ligniaria NRRL 30616 TaxID=1408157 RepID=A0A1J7J7C3_9PEZI|nr:adenine nucleotide alpha hydrolases-like protein [Coniochaeta ligniaria NRRL 30616]